MLDNYTLAPAVWLKYTGQSTGKLARSLAIEELLPAGSRNSFLQESRKNFLLKSRNKFPKSVGTASYRSLERTSC
jgi:hypothetical protein